MISEYLEKVEEQGGDPDLYIRTLSVISYKWGRPDGKQPDLAEMYARLNEMAEAGIVEKRRVKDYRANGTLASSWAEYKLVDTGDRT